LRETLFNVLGESVRNGLFVDCYAGTGAVGLEAVSRGAPEVIFLEQAKSALAVLQQNIVSLGVQARARVIEGPVAKGLQRIRASQPHIVFLDPPYAEVVEYERVLETLASWVERGLIVAEHASRLELPTVAGLEKTRVIRHGDSSLSLFRPQAK
jgi:16S rRNA (guanine966-N2)-methyltransferase